MSKIPVTLDPGHGGTDRANRGPTGYIEADGTLSICRFLKEELDTTGCFDVKLTRDKDMSLGLSERARIAFQNGAQLFISEHTDADTTGKARGCTVFESVDLPDDAFADKMAEAISKAINVPNRGGTFRESTNYPGEDYYTVIDVAQDLGIPHVLLIESAFHSNPLDEAILKTETGLRKIAKAQASVICAQFNVKYPVNAPDINAIIDKIDIITDKVLWKQKVVTDQATYWLIRKLYDKFYTH